MAEDIQRSRGRGQGYKFDRGGTNTEFGPFIGEVKNNVDAARMGRLQVYIEQYSGPNPDDQSLWRTVSYIPPFYGAVQQSGTDTGTGTFVGNMQSYGMWFTPPDIGTQVICFFVQGDPNQGYYMGCVPDPGNNHMIPAIGASKNFELQNDEQKSYFADSKQLPVTEINSENEKISEDPRYFDKQKPVHSVVAAVMLQQGLINDPQRGPITSNSQRESPSRVYGVSTPGRPIYQGGAGKDDVTPELNSLKPEDVKIVGRRGGHSIVMDDGDLTGNDNLVRIRTSKGHQITMSDNGDFFYIVHANGQTWVELGSEGTIDMFSTNSVNVRSQGQINLHADDSINMFAGNSINIKSKNVRITSSEKIDLVATTDFTMGSKGNFGIVSDGSLVLKSASVGGWDSGQSLSFKAGKIDLNGGTGVGAVKAPQSLADVELADTTFVEGKGWEVNEGKLTTIVGRAPTHEPYPYHNKGVKVKVALTEGDSTTAAATPAGAAVPAATNPTAAAVAQTYNLPVTQPVNGAQILNQSPATTAIGSLRIPQVTSMMSSAAAAVGQQFNVISPTLGIGKFGFDPRQLESQGYLKPGTLARYGLGVPGVNAGNVVRLLSSSTIWTGKNYVPNLNALLTNPNLQNLIQQDLMSAGFTALQKKGILGKGETAQQLGAVLQTAVRFGPQAAVNWVVGKAAGAAFNKINAVAKNAQQAIDKATGGLFSIINLQVAANGVINTVARGTVNTAVKGVIGNPKVPTPDFGNPINIDVRQEQQDAKVAAYTQAIGEGKTEEQAQNISAAAGNNAGAAALARAGQSTGLTPGTTGNAPVPAARGLGEFQRDFGTQTAQAPGQSTFLGRESNLPASNTGSNADAALAQPRAIANIDYNSSQFQSQAQLDAEIAREAKLAAQKEAFFAANPSTRSG